MLGSFLQSFTISFHFRFPIVHATLCKVIVASIIHLSTITATTTTCTPLLGCLSLRRLPDFRTAAILRLTIFSLSAHFSDTIHYPTHFRIEQVKHPTPHPHHSVRRPRTGFPLVEDGGVSYSKLIAVPGSPLSAGVIREVPCSKIVRMSAIKSTSDRCRSVNRSWMASMARRTGFQMALQS